jgi:hypothetical protein
MLDRDHQTINASEFCNLAAPRTRSPRLDADCPVCRRTNQKQRVNPVYDFLFEKVVPKRDTLKETDPDSLDSSTSARYRNRRVLFFTGC